MRFLVSRSADSSVFSGFSLSYEKGRHNKETRQLGTEPNEVYRKCGEKYDLFHIFFSSERYKILGTNELLELEKVMKPKKKRSILLTNQ